MGSDDSPKRRKKKHSTNPSPSPSLLRAVEVGTVWTQHIQALSMSGLRGGFARIGGFPHLWRDHPSLNTWGV